jgi:beta-glucosidase
MANKFYWGASTSAHQVEGGCHNDWTEWEHAHANKWSEAAESKRKDERFGNIFLKLLDPKNYISGAACDHYHKYEEDFDIARQLSHNAHRFSIEWSRIEPEEGKFDEAEIEHYKNVVAALRARGLEPFVTGRCRCGFAIREAGFQERRLNSLRGTQKK